MSSRVIYGLRAESPSPDSHLQCELLPILNRQQESLQRSDESGYKFHGKAYWSGFWGVRTKASCRGSFRGSEQLIEPPARKVVGRSADSIAGVTLEEIQEIAKIEQRGPIALSCLVNSRSRISDRVAPLGIALILAVCAGCPTEANYQGDKPPSPETNPASLREAPLIAPTGLSPGDKTAPSAESSPKPQQASLSVDQIDDFLGIEESEETEPVRKEVEHDVDNDSVSRSPEQTDDRYGQTSQVMPWETNPESPDAQTEEVDDLFADIESKSEVQESPQSSFDEEVVESVPNQEDLEAPVGEKLEEGPTLLPWEFPAKGPSGVSDASSMPRPEKVASPDRPEIPELSSGVLVSREEIKTVLPPQPTATSLPLDATNTRRLAWILGAKISVAALSSSSEIGRGDSSTWQIGALAEMLNVPPPLPVTSLGKADPIDAKVANLLHDQRAIAERLAVEHGEDHAALLEIALKTNALAAIYERRPGLAALVARSIEAAAERAKLEESLWRPLANSIRTHPSPEELRKTLLAFQLEVEHALRSRPPSMSELSEMGR